MLLGIPYHVALSYRAGRDWIVYSGEGMAVFTYVAEFIHLFRMPAFFVIAGYFAAQLLARRDPDAWLRGRLMRLGVPFLACLLTLVPLLNLACEVSNFPVREALASWRHNAATSGGYWVRHLWFIIVLLYCSAAAALLARRFPALRTVAVPARVDGWAARHFVAALLATAATLGLWEAAAVEAFYKAGLATNIPQQILRLDELIAFGPWFLIGCVIARAPGTMVRLCRFSGPTAALAAASIAANLIFLDDMSPPLGRFVATFAALSATQVVIALAKRFANRPHPLVEQLVAAAFVIYLFHMPIIILLVSLGQQIALPVPVKALSVMLLALVLSYGAWMIVRRSAGLGFLFNGTPLGGSQLPRVQPA